MPEPKNGERPYLAAPETTFWGSIFGHFSDIFGPECRIIVLIKYYFLYFICTLYSINIIHNSISTSLCHTPLTSLPSHFNHQNK